VGSTGVFGLSIHVVSGTKRKPAGSYWHLDEIYKRDWNAVGHPR